MSERTTSNRLPVLAADIRREHAAVGEAAARGLQHALAAGDALLEAKASLAHGEWSAWLAANVPSLSARTAQLYTRLARNRDRLNAQRVADLSLRAAAALVSRPAAPEPVATLPALADRIAEDFAAAGAALERAAGVHAMLCESLRDFLRRWPVGDMPAEEQVSLCLDVINATAEGVDPGAMEAHRASFERVLAQC